MLLSLSTMRKYARGTLTGTTLKHFKQSAQGCVCSWPNLIRIWHSSPFFQVFVFRFAKELNRGPTLPCYYAWVRRKTWNILKTAFVIAINSFCWTQFSRSLLFHAMQFCFNCNLKVCKLAAAAVSLQQKCKICCSPTPCYPELYCWRPCGILFWIFGFIFRWDGH